MSEEEKRILVKELTSLILSKTNYKYDSKRDAWVEGRWKQCFGEDVKEKEVIEDKKCEVLTNKEMLANLGRSILEDIDPYNLRRAYLGAKASWREENRIAKELGKECPNPHHTDAGMTPEKLEEEWAELHFGSIDVWAELEPLIENLNQGGKKWKLKKQKKS